MSVVIHFIERLQTRSTASSLWAALLSQAAIMLMAHGESPQILISAHLEHTAWQERETAIP